MTDCAVHGYHYPKPIRIVAHHIQPLEMGGADKPENKVDVCDTGHYNIHRVLDDLLHIDAGKITQRSVKGTRSEEALAQRGFDAWVTAGRPGHPVYQLERFYG